MKDSLNKAVMGNLQWPEKEDEKWNKKKRGGIFCPKPGVNREGRKRE